MIRKRISTAFLLTGFVCVSYANVFTVVNTNDSGNGSLRKAISDVNITPGNHSILFNIPVSDPNYNATQGVWRISLSSALPIIMRGNLLIDGSSQTTNQGNFNLYGPEILIDGNNLVASDFAFNIYNVSGVTIKGFIIGGFKIGISVNGLTASNNIIQGNYIGCNYNATDTLSNINGIELLGSKNNIIGGSTINERNIVSGNRHVGIRLANSNNNVVKGNYVGLNRLGNSALLNYDGISIEGTSKYNIIGGYTADERNYVSGNDAYGIPVFGSGCDYNLIIGNYIGTDITGTIAIPNTYGVLFDDGASHNRVGGYEPGAGNLLSGNSGYGVFLYNPGTQNDSVIGNLIGTDWTGTLPLPNANGIVVDGPTFNHFIDGNVVSANLQNGIVLHLLGTDNNIIVGNKIGTDITGTQPLGNGLDGVRIGEGPRYNLVKGNIIAHNGLNGIAVMTAAELYNTFTENAIYNNAHMGIDLFPVGVSLNDPGDYDNGPNELMNFPEIQNVFYDAGTGTTTISGIMDYAINGGPLGIKIELFISDNAQGKAFIGAATADAAGTWSFNCSCLAVTDKVTATATDLSGNTSEFYFDSSLVTQIIEHVSESVSIYPNPSSGELHIKWAIDVPLNSPLFIYDATGKLVMASKLTEAYTSFNLTDLNQGFYIISIHTNQKPLLFRWVKTD